MIASCPLCRGWPTAAFCGSWWPARCGPRATGGPGGPRRRLWLYFAGNCRYEPQGTAPAYRPDLSDGYLDVRIVEARRLARSRLVAAVLTGTLGRSRVYHSWRARSVDVRPADGQPIWLSADGEVATAESGFTESKHPQGLVVYRVATG